MCRTERKFHIRHFIAINIARLLIHLANIVFVQNVARLGTMKSTHHFILFAGYYYPNFAFFTNNFGFLLLHMKIPNQNQCPLFARSPKIAIKLWEL